jgi:hypothetical protein
MKTETHLIKTNNSKTNFRIVQRFPIPSSKWTNRLKFVDQIRQSALECSITTPIELVLIKIPFC